MIINKKDNVEINLENGHKYATRPIPSGSRVIKYGMPIGYATKDIGIGEHVHTHNLRTSLGENESYTYEGAYPAKNPTRGSTFLGYVRENGDIGIRNDIWIIPTVGCVNSCARKIAELTGATCLAHPYGCSQMGEDMKNTMLTLANLALHPNAAGVLLIGLGCENCGIELILPYLGDYPKERIRLLVAQEVTDEVAEGVRLVEELKIYRDSFKRQPVPLDRLVIGLKCGGSDGYSGITANPLLGRVADRLIGEGASALLTEIPEAFGAERLLMKRAENEQVHSALVTLINDWKDYYRAHNMVIYENPSPGNKAGGITTLEEKSLGCVQKGGSTAVTDVLRQGERVKKNGLSILEGPGNDGVAITNLTAAGAHLILFTTGRGTPLGAPIPTVKISTNRPLYEKKPEWIDFDSSPILDGENLDGKLYSLILRVAEGEETKNERNGCREIAIFKSGVTL